VEFDWFRHDERRIGTRVALMATIDAAWQPCTVVVAHLEAFATPEQRCRQMRVLLENLPSAGRVILGGDLNTLGLRPNWRASVRLLGERAFDSDRLTRSVVEREPLFDAARRAGFSWEELNSSEPTWQLNRFVPRALRAKIDWILGRNVVPVVGSARVIAPRAVTSASRRFRLSDHDGVAVNVLL
jgi:endonuclease/exonuclease/phosphatase family metal-dependent hydrolase